MDFSQHCFKVIALVSRLFSYVSILVAAFGLSILNATSNASADSAPLVNFTGSSIGHSAEEPLTLESLIWAPFQDLQKIQNNAVLAENEVQLFYVTSDAIKGTLEIRALVNPKLELQGLKYITEKGTALSFNVDQLTQGSDLMKEGGRSVVKIIGHQLQSQSGGNLEMVYLEDGLSDSYGSFKMNLVNSRNTWDMQTDSYAGGRKFTKMYLKGNWLFGKIVGISEVSVN